MGWGTGPWGTGPWGGASSSISLSSAVAVTTATVRVTVSAAPAHISPAAAGDALNPATWAVTRLDTGASFTVVGVTEVSALQYDLLVFGSFADVSVTHQVESTTLRNASGVLVSLPTTAEFLGLSEFLFTANTKGGLADLANAPAPFNPPGGTLQVAAGGDYTMVSGAELVRKLIVRRLLSTPGEWFHLPKYGLGLRVKETLPSNDLIKLGAAIERQVLREPEVQAVSALLEWTPSKHLLVVQIRAQLTSGEGLNVSLPVQNALVTL